ncbi:hypothetical protein AGMMS49928_10030 [Spirochaetia bacterium]|nr:hypothetical protein AGMMS49928_10030 [Spirochaetia bacterium]
MPQGRKLERGLIILYDDRDIIVADKPAGLLSIASGTEKEKTAYWILSEYLRKKGEKRRPAVVHRLDRDTSGLMIFAKSDEIKRRLMSCWDETVILRRYVALVEGIMKEDEGVIDEPLGEDRGGRMVVTKDGIRALTRWKLLRRGKNFSLLELELDTGRRNQIRAHLFFMGHPVAGDRKYNAKTNPLKRLALHAEKLSFHHPHDGRVMEFTSPVPQGFRNSCT